MTALSTSALLHRMEHSNGINRLVVSPILDRAAQAKPGQAAIDVRLGFDFCLVTASAYGSINEFSDTPQVASAFTNLYRREFVPFGACIIIHPHQFMLAQTLEYVRLPPDLMAYVVGRSTWGRLGLIVATAVGIHPCFAGNITLELRNLGETPLTLYPGQTIAQLFFHMVSDENQRPSQVSAGGTQYAGSVSMIPNKISSSQTRDKLKKLIDRYQDLSST